MPKTRITRLRLADLRNYASLRIDFDAPFVVFTGANGAGKTNLLEAISLMTPGRGLRRAVQADIARAGGSGGFSIFAEVERDTETVALATLVRPDAPSRIVRINETAASAEELLDHLRLVWLTPAMDGLFTGPAADRRRFLDRLVLALDPAHGRRAADYEKAMRGRNRLLDENRMDDAWLTGIEAQMAELGVAMALARAEVVGLLGALIDAGPEEAPFPRAGLALSSGYGFDDLSGSAVELEDRAARHLREGRYGDRAAGRTLEGPHRADLAVSYIAKAMPAALSSTGEQKALLIGLILAHARLVASVGGIVPVLLLDEIAAHLDPGRRAALFDIIEALGAQAFMTGTDASLFEALEGRAQRLTVSNGSLA
ncbi:DNA replication/repair protein RecF [Aurantimonas sp. MSK8Z-1]|uniref:DNA replication/repair protein RecF n=1 Tax=Mangrovibrevibacter kandeliae TaxID=2968473 RepID=UPI0021180BC4|nr:DNA replication/repair protein RecF [Aurantimonas sp. MSK8Z-1]MCW4115813.1 DNA replication/repair protein RecF [Aurantimonas sp. MSK8Z-1]